MDKCVFCASETPSICIACDAAYCTKHGVELVCGPTCIACCYGVDKNDYIRRAMAVNAEVLIRSYDRDNIPLAMRKK